MNKPDLIDEARSINQYYNKKKAKLLSELPKDQDYSHRLNRLDVKRNNKINDYIHKASRYIVDYCLENNIPKIIIGYNQGWKDQINIGKRNNQSFVGIPFRRFIQKLEYKARLAGIEVILHEESYTSKCSWADDEAGK